MSMKAEFPDRIPELTAQVAEAIMKPNSICRWIGQQVQEVMDEEALVAMYHREGRPGIHPLILMIVIILQFVDRMPDRQAAEAVQMRIDYKYALRQELTWPGFHYSDLCNFRKRLMAHGQEFLVFEQLLKYLVEQGYVKRKGKQRTDATHLLADVARLSRLETVWETLRVALNALQKAAEAWTEHHLPEPFLETYETRRQDYRIGKDKRDKLMLQAGRDGFWLLRQVETFGTPALQALAEIELLRQVLAEQFEVDDDNGDVSTREKATGDVLCSPHDPEARYGEKRSQGWHGYKLQVTETVDDPEPGQERRVQFITDVAVTSTIETDNQSLPAIQQRLIERDVPPEKQYVDRAYCNITTILESEAQGIDLRGEVPRGSTKAVGFRMEDFEIDLEQRRAICPAGHEATSFNPSKQSDVAFNVRFTYHCQGCPLKPDCTSEKRGRSLEIGNHHELLMARRREAKTPEFKQEMYHRAAIEGTISELVRAHDMRRSRYRGMQKTRLQAAMGTAALNLKRLVRLLATDRPPTTSFPTLLCRKFCPV